MSQQAGGRMKLKVAGLAIHPYNLDVYGEPSDELKESLERFGQHEPIVVDGAMQIISGARRWTAAKSLGWDEIDGRVEHFDTPEDCELAILLYNKYRGTKPGALRKREADEYLRLLKTGKLTKATIASVITRNNLREDVKTVLTFSDGKTRDVDLAARAAGMSHTTYGAYKYWLDDGGLSEINDAELQGEVAPEQAESLRHAYSAMKVRVARDERGPERPAKAMRRRLKKAKQEHANGGPPPLEYDDVIRSIQRELTTAMSEEGGIVAKLDLLHAEREGLMRDGAAQRSLRSLLRDIELLEQRLRARREQLMEAVQ